MTTTQKPRGKARLEQLKKGIKTEREHKNLYLKIQKRLKEKGIEMPISEKEFYTEIAKDHLKEKKDYYDLLEKYVEKFSEGKKLLTGGELFTNATQIAMDEVNTWSDAKVAQYLGIKESEVDIDRRMDAVDKKAEELTSLWSEMKKGGKTEENKLDNAIKSAKEDISKMSQYEIIEFLGIPMEEYNEDYHREVAVTKMVETKYLPEYAQGGQPRPSPSESATMFPVGYQKIGNDGNWWEITSDYRGVQRWKKIRDYEVKPQFKPVLKAEVKEEVVKELTNVQKSLSDKRFINEDLSLTNKGKRIVELHKYCFPMDVHPFSHIYYDVNDLFPQEKSSYISIGGVILYTGTERIFETGENLPEQIKNVSVQNTVLDGQINATKSDRVEYRAYSFCSGIQTIEFGKEEPNHMIAAPTGYIVFNNFINNNELYISAPVYNYAMKNYDIDRWEADSSNALLLYGLKNDALKVVIRVNEQVIGLYNMFSLFDRERVLSVLKTKYAHLFFQGKSVEQVISATEISPEISVVEIESPKVLSEDQLNAISGLEVMLELAESEEERQQYMTEIEKLKS